MSIRLKIGYTDGRVEERELPVGSYRVGRENADLVLPHGSVSAHHADLHVQPQRVLIRDVGSRNGTFDPDGRRLEAAYALLPDQPIRVGALTLTLVRLVGQAGGTRAMPEAPAAGVRGRSELPPGVAAPPPAVPAQLRETTSPPAIGRWLKLSGVFALLLLGFVSLKTCTALVQAVAAGH